ncbi:glycosyl transferase family protein [Amylibacter marinus]|nr:glycosyl transferase family protein [Amylibacter marinus]
MSDLSKYVHAMGRGPSKGRNLSQDEARDAMEQILSGTASPHAVGALFMLMRYCGETGAEIAGFVQAMRQQAPEWAGLPADIDWPSYAAGRTRGVPWFLLSALLVARAGHRVFMHGWNSHQKSRAGVMQAVQALGLPVCGTVEQASASLARDGFAYTPLATISAPTLELLQLRDVLGLRSPVNTACRAFNPTCADLSVLGVFHPSYRALQVSASQLLGQRAMAVIKGGGGEFECNPSKATEVYCLKDRSDTTYTIAAQDMKATRLADASDDADTLLRVWQGKEENAFARSIVQTTAAVVLQQRENIAFQAALTRAQDLWDAQMETQL